MPVHSSPHPHKDPALYSEDDMPANPYPDVHRTGGGVPPGYDADDWTDVHSDAGRAMGSPYPVMASETYRGGGRRERRHSYGGPPHRSGRRSRSRSTDEERIPYPVPGRPRGGGVSFAARPQGRPSFARSVSDIEDEEWIDENFEHDPYDEDELEEGEIPYPPRPRRAGAWDSSDDELRGQVRREFRREFSEDEEDLDDIDSDDSYAAAIRENMRHRAGGRAMPRGRPGGMRRSGPPPLETPPDSPPPLARGNMSPRRVMRGHGIDPRAMHARGGPPRGGHPRGGRGIPRYRDPSPRRRARFANSPSPGSWSSSPLSGSLPGFGPKSSIRKAMRRLTKPNGGQFTLHPLLRPGSLLRPTELTWNVSLPPSDPRAGIPVHLAVSAFAEPATNPPVSFMRLYVPIPGIDRATWTVDVWPLGSPYATTNQLPPSPYSFASASPTTFARHMLPAGYGAYAPGFRPMAPVVRCTDVLHALYNMLQRRAVENDFWALDERRRDKVSKAFWARCRAMGAAAAAHSRKRRGSRSAERDVGQVEMDRQVNSGVKRIDFMENKTRWEGLEGSEMDCLILKLNRA